MNRESPNAIWFAYGIEADRKERVCRLRLAISNPTVIFAAFKIWVLEIYRGSSVSDR
jgi:hypothetical protein